MRHLPALFLLIACGSAQPFEPAGACTTTTGVGHVFIEDVRDCYCLAAQIDRARAELAAAGYIAADEDLSAVDVYVRAARGSFATSDGTFAYGLYVPTGDRAGFVELDRYAGSIAHELLHHHDMRALGTARRATAQHADWKERGWLDFGERVRADVEAAACK